MKPRVLVLLVFVAVWFFVPAIASANPDADIFTPLADIVAHPDAFAGHLVSVQATYQGWRNAPGSPPVTRSDWVIQAPGGPSIYCTGQYPDQLRPDDPAALGRQVTVLGQVMISAAGQPYLQVSQVTPMQPALERMVSVSQILFDPLGMQGRTIGLLGVLAKGYGPRGNRLYLLADPTGAITLERLPKLYPKGTILRLRGVVGTDSNGLPLVKDVEIVSAKP